MKYLCQVIIIIMLNSCSSTPRCFYIDSLTGKDYFTGRSPDKAWKSLDKLNEQEFRSGDRIFFKAGTEYFGQFIPQGNGTRKVPIVVDMFDDGKKPILHGEGKYPYTLLLDGIAYWEINNLEITNEGLEPELYRSGIRISADNIGEQHHIYLKKIAVHDVNGKEGKDGVKGGGINWQTKSDSIFTRFVDLLIEGCHIYRCYPNGIIGMDGGINTTDNIGSEVIIRNNVIEQFSGSAIEFIHRKGILVEKNTVK